MNNPRVLVVNETKENIDKMTKELEKKKKAFEILGNTGKTITNVSKPAFIGSLLSPFDIEGPLIEIISGVALVAGYAMEKFSKINIEKIDSIMTNGDNSHKVSLEQEDVSRISDAISKRSRGIKEKKAQRQL